MVTGLLLSPYLGCRRWRCGALVAVFAVAMLFTGCSTGSFEERVRAERVRINYRPVTIAERFDATALIETTLTGDAYREWPAFDHNVTRGNDVDTEAIRQLAAETIAGFFTRSADKRGAGEDLIVRVYGNWSWNKVWGAGCEDTLSFNVMVLDARTGTAVLEARPGARDRDCYGNGSTLVRNAMTAVQQELAKGLTPYLLARKPATAPATAVVLPTPITKASAAHDFPSVLIVAPAPDAKTTADQITLVSSIQAASEVQVRVNGIARPVPRDIAVQGSGLRIPVALKLGENVIEIVANDRAGNSARVERKVTRLTPPPLATATGKRWAVVIGVGEYESSKIGTLPYAVRDAEAVYEFLTTQGGYPKDQVLLLTDKTARKPTYGNVRWALGDFLPRSAGPNDTVLIFWAGHGAPEIDTAGMESDGIAKLLVTRDADPEFLYSTAFPMDEIQRIFARIAAERIVFFLDSCYSGTAGGRTFARQGIRAGGLNDQFLERLTRSKGRVIITASGPNEVSLELPDLKHGVFTYYLLEGLRGKADRDGDGIVTISELYSYLEEQVPARARAGGRQRPVMKGEIEGNLPLTMSGR